MKIEAEPSNEAEIKKLESTVRDLREILENPEENGIFDELGKRGMEEKLIAAEEALSKSKENLGRDILENL